MNKKSPSNSLTYSEHQLVIDELQDLILKAIDLMNRFESEDMVDKMLDDYEKLQDILDEAIQKQRRHRRLQQNKK